MTGIGWPKGAMRSNACAARSASVEVDGEYQKYTSASPTALSVNLASPGKFERHSLASVDCDHVTCAVGDVYGNGRLDIVVGNFSSLATDHPVTIWKNMGKANEER